MNLFEIAESMKVSVEVNVVSGYDSLISAVSLLPVTKNLMDEAAQDIVSRCNKLIKTPSDPEFENPYDVALSIYLWVLWQKKSISDAQSIATLVLQGGGYWWARKVAANIKRIKCMDSKTLHDYELLGVKEESQIGSALREMVSEVRRLQHELADPNYMYSSGRIHRQALLVREAANDKLRDELKILQDHWVNKLPGEARSEIFRLLDAACLNDNRKVLPGWGDEYVQRIQYILEKNGLYTRPKEKS